MKESRRMSQSSWFKMKKDRSNHPSKKPSKSISLEDIGLPAVHRFLRPEYSRTRKFVWVLMYVALVALCIWQLYDRISYYFSYPTTFDISVTAQEEVVMPAVTICPSHAILDENSSRFLNTTDEEFNLQDVWDEFSIKGNIKVSVACGPDDDCDKKIGRKALVHFKNVTMTTVLGNCLVVEIDSPMEYRSISTCMNIKVLNRSLNAEGHTSYFALHPHGIYFGHYIYFVYIPMRPQDMIILSLTLKKFYRLSSTRNPCATESVVIECRENCIVKKFEEALQNECRLPITPLLNRPLCDNVIKTQAALKAINDFYQAFKKGECQCEPLCEETVYTAIPIVRTAEDYNSSEIEIIYQNDLIEVVTEKYSYGFSALLSDIGGSLGFFLGFCVFTLLELLEYVMDLILGRISRGIKVKKIVSSE